MLSKALAFSLIAISLIGCSFMPPDKVPEDRHAYLQALNTSWKEQLLYNLLLLQDGEPPTFLDITQILTNYQFEANASAGYEHRWGGSIVGEGTLAKQVIGFPRDIFMAGAGAQYSSSPTITYAPISGETIKNILLRPIPVTDIFRALETGWYPKFIFPYCIQSVNHLRNDLRDQVYFRLVQLWHELSNRKAIHVTFEKEAKDSASEYLVSKTKGKAEISGKDRLVNNLVTFTSKLVQEQKKKAESDEEMKEVIYVYLDKNAPHGNFTEEAKKHGISENELSVLRPHLEKETLQLVTDFKKELGLIRVNINTATKENLIGLNCIKELDWLDSDKVDNIIKNKQGKIDYYSVNDLNKDLKNAGLSGQQREALSAYITIQDNIALENNRFKVVYGYLTDKQCSTNIYVHPTSVLGSLLLASKFIKAPTESSSEEKQDNKNNNAIQNCSSNVQHPIKVKSDNPDMIFPEPAAFADVSMKIYTSSDQPSEEEASVKVKYKGSWFYIRNDDSYSKDVFSSMVVILTMMDTGKKEPPALTLPVR